MAKITVYLRKQGTRQYVLADPKFPYPGSYVLRYRRNGKRVWETLPDGTTYSDARHTAVERECDLLNGITPPKAAPAPSRPTPASATTTGTYDHKRGNTWLKELPAEPTPPPQGKEKQKLMLDKAIDIYLANSAKKSGKTVSAYAYCMQQFYRAVGNKPLASITQQDLIDFVGAMRTEGLADRTIHNRIEEVVCFLRANGMKEVKLRVRYTEKEVRAYRPDELKALFAAADPEEWVLFQFFLCSGAREQEVANAAWDAIDFTDRLFHILETATFTPKDHEEREIPLPDFLMEVLKRRMLNTKGSLIFPSKEGRPRRHMLRTLQALAARAGLVGEFGLHKFRKSYATIQHKIRSGRTNDTEEARARGPDYHAGIFGRRGRKVGAQPGPGQRGIRGVCVTQGGGGPPLLSSIFALLVVATLKRQSCCVVALRPLAQLFYARLVVPPSCKVI